MKPYSREDAARFLAQMAEDANRAGDYGAACCLMAVSGSMTDGSINDMACFIEPFTEERLRVCQAVLKERASRN